MNTRVKTLSLLIAVLLVVWFYPSKWVETSLAAGPCAQQPLTVSVSTNGQNPTSDISIYTTSGRYYLHLGTQCQTNLKVSAQFCSFSNPNCGSSWTEADPWAHNSWAIYRTGDNGIARIDFKDAIGPGIYRAKFKTSGAGPSIAWSNIITVRVSTGQSGEPINLSAYWKYQPGDTYKYKTTNYLYIPSPAYGNTRLQIEEQRNWGTGANCPISVVPWRFTKDDIAAYWNPAIQNEHPSESLRWMVVAPGFNASIPSFNNYFWAAGSKRYNWIGINDLGAFSSMAEYGITAGSVPGYNLGLRSGLYVPYANYNSYSAYNLYGSTSEPACPNPYIHPGAPTYNWWIRVEREVPMIIQGVTYNDIIRADYYEIRVSDFGVLRESWFLARDIGLVKILSRRFNVLGPPCKDSPDCLNDSYQTPDVMVELLTYHNTNQTLGVKVSNNNSSYTTSICTTPTSTYYLKLFYPDMSTPYGKYSGYLESQPYGGTTVTKWLPVENGLIAVNLNNQPTGNYTYRFRTWAPNELHANESALVDANIPWSQNYITVAVQPSCP